QRETRFPRTLRFVERWDTTLFGKTVPLTPKDSRSTTQLRARVVHECSILCAPASGHVSRMRLGTHSRDCVAGAPTHGSGGAATRLPRRPNPWSQSRANAGFCTVMQGTAPHSILPAHLLHTPAPGCAEMPLGLHDAQGVRGSSPLRPTRSEGLCSR